jgi:hypothetical protein
MAEGGGLDGGPRYNILNSKELNMIYCATHWSLGRPIGKKY